MSPDAYPEDQMAGAPRGRQVALNEWMMIAIGLVGLLAVMSMIIATVALSAGGSSHTTVVTVPAATEAASITAAPKPQTIRLAVKADSEHGRLGPDKQWHDAFLPADITVHAGAAVTISVLNYDSGPHSFTSPALGVNGVIPGGGTLTAPSRTTFTFTAPTRPGRYAWWCAVPCDPWAMAHDGYMRGYVTVTA